MSSTPPAPLPPDTWVGGYRLERKLAGGGFGVVYLARDLQGQPWAIKEYLPKDLTWRVPGDRTAQVQPGKEALYQQGLKAFFAEGRSLAQISHSGVVRVVNFFQANGTVYLVMNYLEGSSLQDFITTARQLHQPKVLRESTIRSLADEVLSGVCAVHQHQWLHLDIKPANLLITRENQVVLIDFGTARVSLGQPRAPVRTVYTPGFAAPEMYQSGVDPGPWTDIYALGAVVYACMTGQAPQEAVKRLASDRLDLGLLRLRGIYSDNLLCLVAWCMALEPQARPQSALALQQALREEGERHFSRLRWREKLRLQLDALVPDAPEGL